MKKSPALSFLIPSLVLLSLLVTLSVHASRPSLSAHEKRIDALESDMATVKSDIEAIELTPGPKGEDGALAGLTCNEGESVVFSQGAWTCRVSSALSTILLGADCVSDIAFEAQINGEVDDWTSFCYGNEGHFFLLQDISNIPEIGRASVFFIDFGIGDDVQELQVSALEVRGEGSQGVLLETEIKMELLRQEATTELSDWANPTHSDFGTSKLLSLQSDTRTLYQLACTLEQFDRIPVRSNGKGAQPFAISENLQLNCELAVVGSPLSSAFDFILGTLLGASDEGENLFDLEFELLDDVPDASVFRISSQSQAKFLYLPSIREGVFYGFQGVRLE